MKESNKIHLINMITSFLIGCSLSYYLLVYKYVILLPFIVVLSAIWGVSTYIFITKRA